MDAVREGDGARWDVANCNINANFFRIVLLNMQKEWRFAPEKGRFVDYNGHLF